MFRSKRAVRSALRFAAGRFSYAPSLVDEVAPLGRNLQRFLADRRREALRPPQPAVSKEALAARCARMRNLGGWR